MRKFINKLTGGDMWVADSRVEEYKAAGYKLAADLPPVKPTEKKLEAEVKEEEKPEEAPVKKTTAKRRKR